MKKYIFIAIVLCMGLTGCKDFLVPDNKSAANQSAESYFTNDPSVLRVYAYSLLQPIFGRVDVYEEGVDLYLASNKKTGTKFDQYTVTPEDEDVKSFYSDLYACINMANACIFYDAAGTYTDEMKFIRCLCYYMLTQQFGSVPYVTEYINNANRNYPRTALSSLYGSLISELKEIITVGKLAENNAAGVASIHAAKALLAKVYLAAGWDLNTTMTNAEDGTYQVADKAYFEDAYAMALEAINSQELTMSFEDKWSPNHEQNEEVIFAVQYERSGFPGDEKTGGHGLQNTFGSYYGDCTSTGLKYVNGMHAMNGKSAYLWEAKDLRFDGTFMTTMYNSPQAGWGTVGYYAYYNTDAATLATMPICMRVFSGTTNVSVATTYMNEHAEQLKKGDNANDTYVMVMTYPNIWVNGKNSESTYEIYANGMFATPVVKKFDDPNTADIALSQKNDYRDVVVLHLSDIYLVAAEAALMAGNTDNAETYINKVRTRAGVSEVKFANYVSSYASIYPRFTQHDIDLVLDERARELYAEGHRWIDLRRTKQLVRYNNLFNSELAGGSVKWLKPIPQAEINANDALTNADQNAGY